MLQLNFVSRNVLAFYFSVKINDQCQVVTFLLKRKEVYERKNETIT